MKVLCKEIIDVKYSCMKLVYFFNIELIQPLIIFNYVISKFLKT